MSPRPLLTDYAATVHEQFRIAVREDGERDFLFIPASACAAYAQGPLAFTYAQAGDMVEQLREAYAAAGYGPGHRVAILLENRPAYFFHWLALNAVGASVVPLNPDYRQSELAYALSHSGAALAVVLGHRVADVGDAARAAGGVPVVDADRIARALPRAPAASGPEGRAAECALLYTSGTTGHPKGCLLSNDYFLRFGLRYMNRRGYVELEVGRSRIVTPLPMFHINAMAMSTVGMIFARGCVIQLDRFHPATWWGDVAASRATGAHCLGVMPALLLQRPPEPADTSHVLRFCTAANVEPQHHEAFERRFGVPLVEGWSMTETGSGAAISADHEPRHIGQRCFGRVPPTMELRLVGDDGRDVPLGEPGEMLVRAAGPDPRRGFFSGYLKDEAATEAGWAGGWWHTGDIARRDEDGSMFFVDRKKSLIRRSGENISALEVEVGLRAHESVAQVAVTGVADTIRGEEVFAFVKAAGAAPQDAPQAEAIARWLGTQLAYYKVPGYIAFVEQLPVTSTQKIERGQLKKLAQAHLTEGSCHDLRELKARLRRMRPGATTEPS